MCCGLRDDLMGIDGKRIFLCPLNGDNIDDHLEVYRKASGFSKIYAEIPDLWNTLRDEMRRSLEKEESDVKHYMIVKKGTSDMLGQRCDKRGHGKGRVCSGSFKGREQERPFSNQLRDQEKRVEVFIAERRIIKMKVRFK